MACQGQALPFLYLDPTNSVATARQIGVGDGTNKTFALTHSLGTWWSAPVECVISVTAVYYNGVAQSVGWTYPTASSVKMPTAPTAGVVVTADYTYAYQVRFSEDVIDLEEFMALLHGCRTVKFQSARQPVAAWATATLTAFFVNNTDFVVPGTIDLIEVYSGGAGGVGGGGGTWDGSGSGSHGGGGGGGYAYVRNPTVSVGDVLPIVVGAGGQGLDVNDAFGADINKGGDTYVGPQPSWAGGVAGATPLVWCAGAGKGAGGYQFTAGSACGHFPGYRRRPGRLVPRARRRRRLRRRRRGRPQRRGRLGRDKRPLFARRRRRWRWQRRLGRRRHPDGRLERRRGRDLALWRRRGRRWRLVVGRRGLAGLSERDRSGRPGFAWRDDVLAPAERRMGRGGRRRRRRVLHRQRRARRGMGRRRRRRRRGPRRRRRPV